jgi:hypothetical protein
MGCLVKRMYHGWKNRGRLKDLQFAPYSQSTMSYCQALNGALQGAATYRVTHHPIYAQLFEDSALTKVAWYQMTGTQACTRLVCRHDCTELAFNHNPFNLASKLP